MTAAAIVMGGAGLVLQFASVEVLTALGAQPDALMPLLGQVTGSLLLGFAMVNWMSKGARMGGIYARPLVMGNLVHFLTGALALFKGASTSTSLALWAVAASYAGFAVAFAIVLMTHPTDVGISTAR